MQIQTAARPSSKDWLRLYRWLGASGYVFTVFNLLAATELAQGGCVPGWFESLWRFGFPVAVFACSCLAVKDTLPRHRLIRLGHTLGLATWLAPIAAIVLWHAFGPQFRR